VSASTGELGFYAFDPEAGGSTLKQIFLSTTPGTWPYNGNANLVPVVANGQVFIASSQQLTIFGLLPAATVSPASLSFPAQLVSTTSNSKSVTLSNKGVEVLNLTSIIATGPFSQTNTCGPTLNPNASCTINVTFNPAAAGPATGSISITDNAQGSPQTVTLTGIGANTPPSTTTQK
jgi:hypothetical protein